MRAWPCALLVLLSSAGSADAQRLTPPPGAQSTYMQDAATGRFALPTASYGEDDHQELLTGSVSRQAWRIGGASATAAGALQHLEGDLTAMGYSPVFRCRTDACGGFDFRFGADILPAPAMVIDVADFAQLTMKTEGGRYASILASRALDAVWLQLVMIDTSGTTAATADPAPPHETSPSDGDAEPTSSPAERIDSDAAPADIADALIRQGHATIEGLVFETGGTRLSAKSAEVLDRVSEALTANPSLDVAIVGHTDSVGGFDDNLSLSRQRAEAVRDALIARGLAASRLEARGIAYLAPIASNATAEGRQLNRRVELVLK